jgi:hypothetical protein
MSEVAGPESGATWLGTFGFGSPVPGAAIGALLGWAEHQPAAHRRPSRLALSSWRSPRWLFASVLVAGWLTFFAIPGSLFVREESAGGANRRYRRWACWCGYRAVGGVGSGRGPRGGACSAASWRCPRFRCWAVGRGLTWAEPGLGVGTPRGGVGGHWLYLLLRAARPSLRRREARSTAPPASLLATLGVVVGTKAKQHGEKGNHNFQDRGDRRAFRRGPRVGAEKHARSPRRGWGKHGWISTPFDPEPAPCGRVVGGDCYRDHDDEGLVVYDLTTPAAAAAPGTSTTTAPSPPRRSATDAGTGHLR